MEKYATNRDDLWKIIRALKRFTLSDLHRLSVMNKPAIRSFLDILVKGGFVAQSKAQKGKPVIYSLIKDNGIHRPDLTTEGNRKAPSRKQRMWSAMKVLKRFSHADLALAASVGHIDAKDYCRALRKANYLKVVQTAQRMCRARVYSFDKSKDTGLLAPLVMREGSVFDRNLKQIVWSESEAA